MPLLNSPRARLGVALAIACLIAAVTAGLALGFSEFDYSGHVKGDPGDGQVGFDVDKVGGHKEVSGFTAFHVKYVCDDDSHGRSQGLEFEQPARVHDDGTFKGSGNVIIPLVDPSGRLKGVLDHGKANGTFKIHGELAGPGSACTTGLQKWRATRTHFTR